MIAVLDVGEGAAIESIGTGNGAVQSITPRLFLLVDMVAGSIGISLVDILVVALFPL